MDGTNSDISHFPPGGSEKNMDPILGKREKQGIQLPLLHMGHFLVRLTLSCLWRSLSGLHWELQMEKGGGSQFQAL